MLQQPTLALKSVLSEVLANLAFMFTDDDPADPSPGDVWIRTTIAYKGPSEGELVFCCPKPFARLLAANLLGIDPHDDQAEGKAEDAVKEFMNIVCGQLVTTLHGSEHVYDLTIPQTVELSETPDLSGSDADDHSTLSVEGCRVQLAYRQHPAGQAS